MPNFAANLSMMYTEFPFLDRFAAAAKDGFKAVEFLFPYAFKADELRRRLDDNKLELVLFNAPPGDWDSGERGLASLQGREDEFKKSISTALEYSAALNTRRLHVMAGIVPPGAERDRNHAIYLSNLEYAARSAASAGVTILIEPINTRDIPGFFLNKQEDAHAVCAKVGAANLKVQMDFYHCQIVQGDLAMNLRKFIGGIGHIQIAGVPERHEPDLGEINYPYLLGLVDTLGYDGWVGCEYRPRKTTEDGIGWIKPYLK